jgi:hypothetical protein
VQRQSPVHVPAQAQIGVRADEKLEELRRDGVPASRRRVQRHPCRAVGKTDRRRAMIDKVLHQLQNSAIHPIVSSVSAGAYDPGFANVGSLSVGEELHNVPGGADPDEAERVAAAERVDDPSVRTGPRPASPRSRSRRGGRSSRRNRSWWGTPREGVGSPPGSSSVRPSGGASGPPLPREAPAPTVCREGGGRIGAPSPPPQPRFRLPRGGCERRLDRGLLGAFGGAARATGGRWRGSPP